MQKEWFATFQDAHWLLGAQEKDDKAEARFLRRALRLRRGSRVLDAPCGKGRISVPLAEAGCRVTAVDLNPRFLGIVRRRFTVRKLSGKILHKDLREIDFEAAFDAVCNWFGSFGYFSDEENAEVLRRFALSLRPGGRLLVDQVNRERILRDFKTHFEIRGMKVRNRWDPKRQRVEGTWTEQGRRKRKRSRSSIRIYTPHQLRRLFRSAGLQVESIFGDAEGRAFSRSSSRLVMVGRKA